MIWPILEARAEIEEYFFVHILVQMKTSKFAFEINWPLAGPAGYVAIMKSQKNNQR